MTTMRERVFGFWSDVSQNATPVGQMRYISLTAQEAVMARSSGKAPKQITWVICLVLYVVALLAHFRVVKVPQNIGEWAWIIGFGLLLVAVQVRDL